MRELCVDEGPRESQLEQLKRTERRRRGVDEVGNGQKRWGRHGSVMPGQPSWELRGLGGRGPQRIKARGKKWQEEAGCYSKSA